MSLVRFLEVPLKAQKAHSQRMGFCCFRARAKPAWASDREQQKNAREGMIFLYFQAGNRRNSERSELSPGAKKIRLSLPPNQLPMKDCPLCKSPYGYALGDLFACPECGHEWNTEETEEKESVVKDANGNILENGDSVVVIKDLPVKGAPKPVKAGTKVKNIRLTDGDHNIDCKIDGFGSMALKSEFVRKA